MNNNTPLSSKIRAAAYVRYSSVMQNDSFTLEAQLRQIKLRAASDGIDIVKVYSDPANSAYKNRFRPGINEMLQDAQKKDFDLLYVHKVDRLARRLEWAIEIVKELQGLDINLKAVEQNFDLATPEGKLMFHLLGSLGEFYSDNLSKETHKGKYERASQGYHNGWVPWGFKSEKVGEHKMAVPDPNLIPIVVDTFERFSTGLYYDQDIADWLNAQGLRTRFNRLFTKDAVRDLLQNEFYKGVVSYRGTYAHNGKTRRKADGEKMKGLHTPIISDELFEKCQKVRADRRHSAGTNQTTRRVYYLSGILVCAHCNHHLRAQTSPSNRYYREVSRLRGEECKFDGRSVVADQVEMRVSEIMESLVLPDDWQATLQEMLNTQKDEMDPQKEMARIKGEMRRMREAFKAGLYENDEYSFWRGIESLQEQLSSLEQITPHEFREAGKVLVSLKEAWHIATLEERREFCQIILKQVAYDFERGVITRILPNPEYEVLFKLAGDSEVIAYLDSQP